MKPGKRHHYSRLDTGDTAGYCYYDLPAPLRKLIDEFRPASVTQQEKLAKLLIQAIAMDRKQRPQ